MRIQWCSQHICYIFIAILIASGMCVEVDNSHSYFACETTEATPQSQYTHSQSFIKCDYCTTEILQNNSQYIRNNSSQRVFSRRTRGVSTSIVTSTDTPKTFYFVMQYLTDAIHTSSSQINILEYIHRQDGKK